MGRKGKVCYSKVQEPEGKAEAEKRALGTEGRQPRSSDFKSYIQEADVGGRRRRGDKRATHDNKMPEL